MLYSEISSEEWSQLSMKRLKMNHILLINILKLFSDSPKFDLYSNSFRVQLISQNSQNFEIQIFLVEDEYFVVSCGPYGTLDNRNYFSCDGFDGLTQLIKYYSLL